MRRDTGLREKPGAWVAGAAMGCSCLLGSLTVRKKHEIKVIDVGGERLGIELAVAALGEYMLDGETR